MSRYKKPELGSVVSTGVLSARMARQLAARCLPDSVKKALKTGSAGAAIDALRRMRARRTTRGLSADRIFHQSAEHRLAGAAMSVVVPVHDAPLVTNRCLLSLERYATNAEIILVDDASKLVETVEMIREYTSKNRWKVISNTTAGGHSDACRAGARVATRPYLCLLNSDTVVTPWCWRMIQETFESDSTIGVAGPSTSSSGGNAQTLGVARDCRFEWNDSQICAFAERLSAAHPRPVILDLPWVAGFAFFIRRSLWEELSGFDEHLKDYANEVDLCKRVVDSGHRIVWNRTSYIHHFGAQSYGQTMASHDIQMRQEAGMQYVRRKHNLMPDGGLLQQIPAEENRKQE